MRLNSSIVVCLFLLLFPLGMMTGCPESAAPSEEGSTAQENQQEMEGGSSGSSGPSVCDEAMLAKVASRTESLTKACLLPVSLIPLVSALEKGGEEDNQIFAENILNASDFIERACPDYDAVFKSLATLASDDKKEALISGCHLDRLGVATKEELLTFDGIRALVGCAVYQWMASHRIPGAKKTMRAWMKP